MIRAYRNHNHTIKRIQILGMRCSGTNFLEALIRRNIGDDYICWDYGWKHWFLEHDKFDPAQANDCLFLTLYRHPLSWIQSFQQQPWHAPEHLKAASFDTFIRSEWYSVYDADTDLPEEEAIPGEEIMGDRNPETGQRFPNVIRMRNGKIRHWEELKSRYPHCCYLRYEDLKVHPEQVLRILAARYDLPMRLDFATVGEYKGTGVEYAPKDYAPLSHKDIFFIARNLHLSQEWKIGYKPSSILLPAQVKQNT